MAGAMHDESRGRASEGFVRERAAGTVRLPLRFPTTWAVALPGHAPEMAARAEEWLRVRGVVRDEASARKFAELAVAEYANWPFATAAAAEAEVITAFLALWIFYDDVLEEADDGQRVRICDAIAGRPDTCPEGDAHLRCWWELGRRCADRMGPAWVERHAARFLAWVDAVRDESTAAAAFRRSGVSPASAEHLARRRLNIGMMPNIDFIEYQLGRELPAAVVEDPAVVRLSWLAAEAVAIINDLFGYAKDRHLRWANLVGCVQSESGASLGEAFATVVAMLGERIAAITACEVEVRRRVRDAAIEPWLQGMRHVIYGFARWHAMAPRYAAQYGLEDGRTLVLVVESG